jgi:hypothetical protein
MISIQFIVLLLLIPMSLYGQQTEQYDIVSFSPPKGWRKENNSDAISYFISNNKSQEWCRLMVYKSLVSTGNPATDFDHEWNELVTKNYEGTIKPNPDVTSEGGWTAHAGVSKFTWQGQECSLLLNTITGYGRVVSIAVSMRGQSYLNTVEQFLNSIELQLPSQDIAQQDVIKVTQSSNSNKMLTTGITKATTSFDDGWTAHAMDDYVLMTKENTYYYMHYGIPLPTQANSDESITTKENWERFITPRYNVTNVWLNPDVGSFGGSFNYYAEGTGTEKRTGKQVFIGFRTIIAGAHFCVEGTAPTKEEYLKHFPTLKTLSDMRNSNRFAITKEDILGDWSSSSSSTLQYYNLYTGENAGMQFSQGGQEFFFRNNSEYNARISGAMGNMGGSQVAFDNKYKGNFAVTDWEITLTDYGGVTQVFTAYFEAVKGGRILHIAKKDAPGVQYVLIKIK